MNAEQKQRAMQMLRRFSQTTPMTRTADNAAVAMAALLQDLVDAPEPEPFGYFKSEPFGWTDCAETDDGAIALYTAPSEPKPVARVTGYYAGYLSIATVDGRVLPTGTALYTAPPASSVPDGWKLVPVEPTPETIAAIEKQWMIGSAIDMAEREYKAMLAATLTPAEAPADVARDAEREFIRKVAEQSPEKPDYWSSCSQCEHNASEAQELIGAAMREKGGA